MDSKIENFWRKRGFNNIVGIDEAGRGCIFGPVYAAAVILPDKIAPRDKLRDIKDSKILTPEQRGYFSRIIKDRCVDFGVGSASVDEIDKLNILNASLLAMERAVDNLSSKSKENMICLIDGNRTIKYNSISIVDGDRICLSIAAASIIAKVERDNLLIAYDRVPEFSCYNLAANKGYCTKSHMNAIREYGISRLHRRTFAPVKELDFFSH